MACLLDKLLLKCITFSGGLSSHAVFPAPSVMTAKHNCQTQCKIKILYETAIHNAQTCCLSVILKEISLTQ